MAIDPLKHIGLAFFVAHRYRSRAVSRGICPDDLHQEAFVGLVRAALLYDPGRGFLPSTFLVDCIRKRLHHFIESVFQFGGTPFIAFKENSTGGKGGLFEKMFHFYSMNKEEYMDRYHKRSNVESVFSMVKAKFRDDVRSKTDVAMRNEALCKILAHNLCCLIMSQFELGIEPVFWGNEKPVKAVREEETE